MRETMKMLMVSFLVGILLVAAVLAFYALGATNLVPWLLVLALLIIPVYFTLQEKKQFVVWKDQYSVGVDVLDDDHKKLLNLINKMQTSIQYRTDKKFEKEALDELVAYTKYHFDREEKMMEEANYPDLKAHRQKHRDMIAKLDRFLVDYEARGYKTLEDISLFLRDWLIAHINGTDQKYSETLQRREQH